LRQPAFAGGHNRALSQGGLNRRHKAGITRKKCGPPVVHGNASARVDTETNRAKFAMAKRKLWPRGPASFARVGDLIDKLLNRGCCRRPTRR